MCYVERRTISTAICVAGAGVVAGVFAGCGGSTDLNAEQVASIKAETKRQLNAEHRQRTADEKLKQLERQVRELSKRPKKAAKRAAAPAPASPPPSSSAPSSGGSASCGGGISVNSVTTCPFAANVAAAFYSDGPGTVYASSPVTGQTYAMSCSGGVPTVCTGGNGAAVYIR